MILCDQMSRNAFRNTPEAFLYDVEGITCARAIVEVGAHLLPENESLSYFMFLMTPGQHSEDVKDHDMNLALIQHCKKVFGEGNDMVKRLEGYVVEHEQLCRRFGRYPWRNEALGRENTKEEVRKRGRERRVFALVGVVVGLYLLYCSKGTTLNQRVNQCS